MYAIRSYYVPDIITMAKALGSGIPIAAFASTDEITASFTRPSASTFGGNPVSSVTGLAVLDYIEANHMAEHSLKLGEQLLTGLKQLAEQYADLSDVRGAGLIIGAELCADDPARGAILV